MTNITRNHTNQHVSQSLLSQHLAHFCASFHLLLLTTSKTARWSLLLLIVSLLISVSHAQDCIGSPDDLCTACIPDSVLCAIACGGYTDEVTGGQCTGTVSSIENPNGCTYLSGSTGLPDGCYPRCLCTGNADANSCGQEECECNGIGTGRCASQDFEDPSDSLCHWSQGSGCVPLTATFTPTTPAPTTPAPTTPAPTTPAPTTPAPTTPAPTTPAPTTPAPTTPAPTTPAPTTPAPTTPAPTTPAPTTPAPTTPAPTTPAPTTPAPTTPAPTTPAPSTPVPITPATTFDDDDSDSYSDSDSDSDYSESDSDDIEALGASLLHKAGADGAGTDDNIIHFAPAVHSDKESNASHTIEIDLSFFGLLIMTGICTLTTAFFWIYQCRANKPKKVIQTNDIERE